MRRPSIHQTMVREYRKDVSLNIALGNAEAAGRAARELTHHAKLERRNRRAQLSRRCRTEAYLSCGMKRTPYGWE